MPTLDYILAKAAGRTRSALNGAAIDDPLSLQEIALLEGARLMRVGPPHSSAEQLARNDSTPEALFIPSVWSSAPVPRADRFGYQFLDPPGRRMRPPTPPA